MSKSPFRKVTQKDVAKAAGVSQALVSLVLGGEAAAEISSENRQRIVEVAAQLGYKGRRKQTADSRSKLLAHIYPVVKRVLHAEEWIFKGYDEFYDIRRSRLEAAVQARGYSLMSYAFDGEDSARLTQWLSEWEIQGVFWNSEETGMAEWIQKRLPLVQIDRRQIEKADAVMSNQGGMVQEALSHLYDKGHRRIGFVSKFPYEDFPSQRRIARYREFVQERDLEAFDYTGRFATEGVSALVEIFRRAPGERPTALVAADHHALLLQKALLSEGCRLPEHLSLVGIDNIPASALIYPALTSVDGEYGEVAASAMMLMEDRLANPKRTVRTIEVSPTLVERESVRTLTPKPSAKAGQSSPS
ncbi:MAG TPA: LacI family DNA-binding transcriptional regulator [Chthoniobacteraceae bacterium]|nr:LacI family DNA-binding transcriptional regulator [Chthoniobacteraceae bacterium]